jgi:hypothetical protein
MEVYVPLEEVRDLESERVALPGSRDGVEETGPHGPFDHNELALHRSLLAACCDQVAGLLGDDCSPPVGRQTQRLDDPVNVDHSLAEQTDREVSWVDVALDGGQPPLEFRGSDSQPIEQVSQSLPARENAPLHGGGGHQRDDGEERSRPGVLAATRGSPSGEQQDRDCEGG